LTGPRFETRLVEAGPLATTHEWWELEFSFPWSKLHRVLIDVVGDRLALNVADVDCARIVHTSPHPHSIAVQACSRNLGVRAAGLSKRRQRKRLFIVEVAEENGRRRTGKARVSSWVFRM